MTYRRKDAHYHRARAAGYRARSAYKLIELDDRFGVLRDGDHVVDLGAWPGGWLQVIAERIGSKGRAVGVDVAEISPVPGVQVIRGDVRDPTTVQAARAALGRPADVVLSDLAPKLTGVPATDEARCDELHRATLATLPTLLRPGGRLLMKLFMNPSHADLVGEIRRTFGDVHVTKPDATRRGSAELYMVATGFRGTQA